MLLSIVIVNYNTPELTGRAIDSVIRHAGDAAYEIIVVNNGDHANHFQDSLSRVRTMATENKGFGHACNEGANLAQGEILLFLNPDTLVHEGTLDACVRFFQSQTDVGALGVRTLREDGAFDHGCKRGFPTPWASLCYFSRLDRLFPKSRVFGAYRQTFVAEDTVCDVDSVSGSSLLTPRSAFDAVGGFDEAFFMYGEDLDLCYRIKQAGYRVVYFGLASITHLKGQSGLQTRSAAVTGYFYDAMALFYEKHYESRYSVLTTFLVTQAIRIKRKRAMHKLEAD